MTLFFKRIRQKLLIEKKFGKYLFYAIGEILILAIGILFAVQVDRWNQKQQDRTVEISILKTIKADLEKDLINLQIDIDLHEESIASSRIIQDHLENNRPYNDSLSYRFIASFFATYWLYNSGGIQSLKSLGVNTITNDSIRNQLITLYDFRYNYMRYLTENMNTNFLNGEQNILRSRFDQAKLFGDMSGDIEWDPEWVKWDQKMIPLDYEGLKNDTEYKFHLKTYTNEVFWYLLNCGDTKNMISQAISNIEEEIKKLE